MEFGPQFRTSRFGDPSVSKVMLRSQPVFGSKPMGMTPIGYVISSSESLTGRA